MTSRIGQPNSRRAPSDPILTRGHISGRPQPGFTLVELILVIALLVVSAGLLVINLAGWHRYSFLEEGADRFATLARMARAESANRGRCLRLSFSGEDHAPAMLWENDPLAGPGKFVNFKAAWTDMIPTDLVKPLGCRLTGPAAFRTLAAPGAQGDKVDPCQAITFYPDGSSDSAELTLMNVNEQDTRVAVIDLNGLTGTVTKRILSAKEYQ